MHGLTPSQNCLYQHFHAQFRCSFPNTTRHVSQRKFLDAISVTVQPVDVSYSALHPHYALRTYAVPNLLDHSHFQSQILLKQSFVVAVHGCHDFPFSTLMINS